MDAGTEEHSPPSGTKRKEKRTVSMVGHFVNQSRGKVIRHSRDAMLDKCKKVGIV